MLDRLNVQITKTADGSSCYLQIMSADMVALNIVLVADKIVVKDDRQRLRRERAEEPA